MKKCILLLSGGFDSVVALKLLLDDNYTVYPIFIDYGQKSLENEKRAVDFFCHYYNLPKLKVAQVNQYDSFKEHPLLKKDLIGDKNKENDSSKLHSANYVPFRNLLFSCVAAIYSTELGVTTIAFGFIQNENRAPFSDASLQFIEQLTKMFEVVEPEGNYHFISPTINYRKSELMQIAIDRKIPFENSYSCYNEEACGECTSCLDLKAAKNLSKI